MRVIAGEFKGRNISSVKGKQLQIRYTADKVKESLFRIIGEAVIGRNFLDLCAGSGNVGIEALSRGAKQVVFVDANPLCAKAISDNLRKLDLEAHLRLKSEAERVKVIRTEARTAIEKLAKGDIKFDLIFIDPPYESDLLEQCLMKIASLLENILSLGGSVIAEHRKNEKLKERYGSMSMIKQKKYGDTVLSFFEVLQNSHESHESQQELKI